MKMSLPERGSHRVAPPPPMPPKLETRREPMVMSDDQSWVLSQGVLRVAANVEATVRSGGRVVVASAAQGQMLGISATERSILEAFGKGRKVPEVLSELMIEGKSPPVSEFYELVLKAVDRGILLVDGAAPPPRRRALDLPFTMPFSVAILLIAGAFGLGGYGLLATDLGVDADSTGRSFFGSFETNFLLPRGGLDYFSGILLVFIAVSLGSLMGAAVARAADVEVYGPIWTWMPPLPHLRFDLRATRMTGRMGETLTGLIRAAPVAGLIGAVLLWFPHLALAVFIGALWWFLPTRGGAVAQILSGLFGRVPVDTQRELRFEAARRTWSRLWRRLSQENRSFAVGIVVTWLLWVTGAIFLFVRVFPALTLELAPGLASAPLLSAVVASAALLPAGLAVRAGLRNGGAALRERRLRRVAQLAREAALAPYNESCPPPPEKVAALLKESVLFGGIDTAEREAIARSLEPRFVRKGEVLVGEETDRKRVFLVFKGDFEVCRELASGRLLRLARLKHGDVFGTVPLWDEPPRARTVRALGPGIVYSLTSEEFEAAGLSKESRAAVKDAVKASFLLRVPFFREWSRETVRRFARAGSFVTKQPGWSLGRLHDSNLFFHIFYDGTCEYSGNLKRSRLGIGDFFGELDMFTGIPSELEVSCRDEARFLVFSRNDFLRAVCEQPEAVLAFEKRCSRRLGRPVFPLRHGR